MMKSFFLKLFSFSCVFFLSTLIASEVLELENGNLLLKNDYIQALFSPEEGGRILSLIDLNTKKEYTIAGQTLGMAGELNWINENPTNSSWFGKPFISSINKTNDGTVELELQRSGAKMGGNIKWFTIKKTFRLPHNSSSIELDYSVSVHNDAMNRLPFSLWTHHCLYAENKTAKVYYPGMDGIKNISYSSMSPANETFNYQLSGAWAAFSCEDTIDSGLALQADFRDIMCLYNWQGDVCTLEFLYRTQVITSGESYDTKQFITVYNGLEKVDGANNGWIGEFKKDGNSITGCRIYSSTDATAKMNISVRDCPGSLEMPLLEKTIEGKVGEIIEISCQVEEKKDLLKEVICRLIDKDGNLLMMMASPLGSGKYERIIEGKARGNLQERFGAPVFSDANIEDCYNWAKSLPLLDGAVPWLKAPYSGGTIKLLALTDHLNGRELYELAGRMDAELFSCSFTSRGHMSWHNSWGHNGGIAEINTVLKKMLKEDYDCILLGGMQLTKSISEENLKTIAAKIQNGTGLVCVQPTFLPQFLPGFLPVSPKHDLIHINRRSFLTNCLAISTNEKPFGILPLTGLPQILLYPYEANNAIAKCETSTAPVLVTDKYGKGKTAVFTWLSGLPSNSAQAGILPYLEKKPCFPAHEYFYGMLIKQILSVTKRMPSVELTEVIPSGNGALFTIKNKNELPIEVDIDWQCLHDSGKELNKGSFTRQLLPGENSWQQKFITSPLNGNNFLNVRICSKNFSLDFAAAHFLHKAETAFIAANLSKNIFLSGEAITVNGKVTGINVPIGATLRDKSDRLLGEVKVNSDNNGNFQVTFQTKYLYENYGHIILEVFNTQKILLDRLILFVDMVADDFIKREWHQFQFTIGWPTGFSRALPFYLHDEYQEQLRNIGFNTVYGLGISAFPIKGQDTESMTFVQRGGFRNVLEAIARIQKGYYLPYYTKWKEADYNFRKTEIQVMQEKYNATRDSSVLLRDPPMDSPEYLTDYYEGLSQFVSDCRKKWFTAIYDLADEFSYTYADTNIDLDFSPDSLKLFRKWLQEQYVSLNELNQEWERNFKSWDDVRPDTAWEATQRNVYSAWGMHRLYNTDVFVNFIRVSADAIKKADPEAKISMSGTRAPGVYTGCDWSRIIPLLDAIFPYNYGGQGDIHRSFGKIPRSGWGGYVSSAQDNEAWINIWRNIANGHFGVAIFSGPLMIAPDMRITEAAKVLSEITEPLRNGIGNLLYNSDLLKAEIAIHFSMPSIMAAFAERQSSELLSSRLGWIALLRSLGYSFKFLSNNDIEKGGLANYKILILPCSIAMSDKECEEINQFVTDGNCLIADFEPALYNQRIAKIKKNRVQLNQKNIFMLDYPISEKLSSDHMRNAIQVLTDIALRQNISNNLEFISFDGKGSPEITVFEIDYESKLCLILSNTEMKGKLSIPGNKICYDVLKKKQVTDNEVSIPSKLPVLLALLPYAIKEIACEMRKMEDGSILLEAKPIVSHGKAGSHTFNFTVFPPNCDKPSRLYSTIVDAPFGVAEHKIYPALNEQGEWKAIVEDVVSGQSKAMYWTLR